jgi:hypothetical protein
MLAFLKSTKSRISITLVAVVLLSALIAAVFFGLNGNPPSAQESDPQNDIQTDVGSSYPGMIDIVGASIQKNQSTFNSIITVKDPITTLSEGESAQFNLLVILENEEDVLQTYEFLININSTGMFGIVQDVQMQNPQPLQLNSAGTKLTMTAILSELNDATKAEWNIYSTYEKIEENQVVANANDFVPDEGLRVTNF